jgi:hypothetical protein
MFIASYLMMYVKPWFRSKPIICGMNSAMEPNLVTDPSLSGVLQELMRKTRRATIWQQTTEGWKIMYHQGTVVQDAE